MKSSDIKNDKSLWIYVALISLIVMSVFFRIYALEIIPFMTPTTNIERAQDSVLVKLRSMLGEQIRKSNPKISERKFDEKLRLNLQATMSKERTQFDDAALKLAYKIPKPMDVSYSKKYFHEADSYYYFNLTENILLKDSLGADKKIGSFFNPLRKAPIGTWDRVSVHPYVGATLYRILKFLDPNISLTFSLSFLSIILHLLTILLFFFFCLKIEISIFGSWIATFVLTLAPITIQRTGYGWYDTDPYHLLFFVMTLFCYAYAVNDKKNAILYALVAGLGMACYSTIYGGWSFLFLLMSGLCFAFTVLHYWKYRKLSDNASLHFFITYILVSLILEVQFMGFDSLVWSVKAGVQYVTGSLGGGDSASLQKIILPNLLNFINETRQLGPQELMYAVSNNYVFPFVVLGTLIGFIQAVLTKNTRKVICLLMPILLLVPLVFISIRAMRFLFFVIVPYAILAGYAADLFYQLLNTGLKKSESFIPRFRITPYFPIIAILIICGAIMPRSLHGAHVAAVQQKMTMDDHWFGVLDDIRKKTDPEMVIFSDWAPGYFINGVARRKNYMDGGSQTDSARYYWMAKAFMGTDEKYTLGIFRMLSRSGTEAFQELAKEMKLDDAVSLIDSIVAVSYEEAIERLPQGWSEDKKATFLNLTHGKATVPVGVLIYDDLIEKTPMLEMFSKWNFDRAEKVLGGAAVGNRVDQMITRGDKNFNTYPEKIMRVVGSFSPFKMKIAVNVREKDQIFFEENFVVDQKNKRAFVPKAGSPGELEPAIMYYKENNKWVHTEEENASTRLVVVHYPVGKSDHISAIASNLMDTTLFRLFYLEAQNLDYFKPISRKGSLGSRTYVQGYEIDWPAFEQNLEAEKVKLAE